MGAVGCHLSSSSACVGLHGCDILYASGIDEVLIAPHTSNMLWCAFFYALPHMFAGTYFVVFASVSLHAHQGALQVTSSLSGVWNSLPRIPYTIHSTSLYRTFGMYLHVQLPYHALSENVHTVHGSIPPHVLHLINGSSMRQGEPRLVQQLGGNLGLQSC